MRYYIQQVSDNSTEKIVGKVYSEKHFVNKISNYVKAMFPEYKEVQSVTFDTIKTSDKFIDGTYLLNSKTTMQLVKKSKIVSTGYIYNSFYFDTKLLFTWKMIEAGDLDINTETSDVQVNWEIKEFNQEALDKTRSVLISGKRGTGRFKLLTTFINKLNKSDDFIENSLFITNLCANRIPSSLNKAKFSNKIDKEEIEKCISTGKGCIVFIDFFNKKTIHDFPENIIKSTIPFVIIEDSPSVWSESDVAKEVDYIFCLAEDYKYLVKSVWKKMAINIIPNFDVFERNFNEYTKEFGCMVFNNKIDGKTIYYLKN